MGGALIETEARIILNQGKRPGMDEANKKTAARMLKKGKFTIEEIAGYCGLTVGEVEQLAENL